MRITGNRDHIKFDLENGYVMKAEGEILVGGRFVVYKNTMKCWEEPHKDEKVSDRQIEKIISEVQKNTNKNTVQLIFE